MRLFDWRQRAKDTDIVAVADFVAQLLASRFRLMLSHPREETRREIEIAGCPNRSVSYGASVYYSGRFSILS